MKDLNYQLMKLCKANRDGSYATQATRSRILDLIANQLHELGYKHMQARSPNFVGTGKCRCRNSVSACLRCQKVKQRTTKNAL